jgi:hypothetical protein
MSEHCACGRPLHYTDPQIEAAMEEMVERLGSEVMVTLSDGRSWWVPRHYIALHALKGSELPTLGFRPVEDPSCPR